MRRTGAAAGRYYSSTTSWSWGLDRWLSNSEKIHKKNFKKSKQGKKKTTFLRPTTTV
jgi:hypothetical protein